MVVNGWQLNFSERFDYSRFNDIVLPLKLSSDKANQILLRAKVDTGSTFGVFQRRYADLLNIDISKRATDTFGSFLVGVGSEIIRPVVQLAVDVFGSNKASDFDLA